MAALLQSLGYKLYASGANVVRGNPEAAARGQVSSLIRMLVVCHCNSRLRFFCGSWHLACR